MNATLLKFAAPLLLAGFAPKALAQGTAFTYQGRLSEDGQPANGNYDLAFQLFDAPVNGNAGSDRFEFSSQAVSDGLFTVELDFGPFIFTGQDLWLQLEARAVGEPTWDLLSSRQPITPAPYAIHAATAGSAPILNGSITSDSILDGSVQAGDLDLSTFDGTFWRAGGNAGTTPDTHFLGTSDNQPLEFQVNGQRALLLEPTDGVPNLIGGGAQNSAGNGVLGATIGGGGTYDPTRPAITNNEIYDEFGTIGGGGGNRAGNANGNPADAPFATVAGGKDNRAEADDSSVGGGDTNIASGAAATIGGGRTNSAGGDAATVGGGASNQAAADTTTVGGGFDNEALADYGTIGGGTKNRVFGDHGTVAGGVENQADLVSTVGGGAGNKAIGWGSTIAGGQIHTVNGPHATVGGGLGNTASGESTTIAGGQGNIAQGRWAAIGGGSQNTASGEATTIAGGGGNTAQGRWAAIGGGVRNAADGEFATIAGGGPSDFGNLDTTNNRTSDNYNTIGGGGGNRAGNDNADTTDATFATVGGGANNQAANRGATIAGGEANTVLGFRGSIGGGVSNSVPGDYSVISGGANSTAVGQYSTIAGGESNAAAGSRSAVAGGANNSVSGDHSIVSGGSDNSVSGNYSAIPGGLENEVSGSYSFGGGWRAKVQHNGSFVWADNSNADLLSTAHNEFKVRATGGVYFYSGWPVLTGVKLPAGSGSFMNASSVHLKTDFRAIDPCKVLGKVAALDIQRWRYKTEAEGIEHLGPVAEEFYEAFELGASPEGITGVDGDGVALAAIQGLNGKLESEVRKLNTALESKEEEIDQLRNRLGTLEALVAKLAARGGRP